MNRMLLLLAGVALVAFSQGGGRREGRNVPRYDRMTEATFSGTIGEVREVDHPGFRGKGLHATLKTEQGSFDVHLGPVWFIGKEKFSFAKGEEIEVVGSKVDDSGGPSVIARAVKKGDKTLTLRNQDGVPLWSRGRRQALP